VKRFVSSMAGTALCLVPAFFFFTVLVPVPQYRSGTYADFTGAAGSCLTLYGGEVLGILVLWWQPEPGRLTGRRVFWAGFWGGVIAISLVTAGQFLFRWVAGESVSVGNLWGLVVIFGAAFSAMVAAGAGMAWYGVHGSHRSTRA